MYSLNICTDIFLFIPASNQLLIKNKKKKNEKVKNKAVLSRQPGIILLAMLYFYSRCIFLFI